MAGPGVWVREDGRSSDDEDVDLLIAHLLNWYSRERMREDVFAPIGPSYVAARLEEEGYRVRVRLYRHREGSQELLQALQRNRPRVLGISATGNEIPELEELTREVKASFPDLPLVAGGYCSLAGEELFEDSGLDAVVRGEGEETMAELMPLLLRGEEPGDVPGVLYRSDSGEVIANEHRERIDDLDELPIPVYEHVPREPRLLRVYASRGCPYECTFCEIKDFLRRRPPRRHSASYVKELVGQLRERAGDEVEYLYFNDDEFLLYAEHLEEMARAARDLGLEIVFQTRVNDVIRHRDTIEAHRDVIHEIHMGAESMCASQLQRWRKKATPETNMEAAEILSELGISYYPYIILTDSETTPEELHENCQGLLSLPPAPVAHQHEGRTLRPVVPPLRREIHMNRLKSFRGEVERKPETSYLEAVWDFLAATEEEATRTKQLYLGASARATDPDDPLRPPADRIESLGDVIDGRITVLPKLAARARDGAPEAVVQEEAERFRHRAQSERAALLGTMLGNGAWSDLEVAGSTSETGRPR